MKTLRGKKVLITGAAQGIGKQTALRFAQEGAALILVDLRPEQLPQAVADVKSAGAADAWSYQLDVTDFDAIPELRSRIFEAHGAIDVLVNNAGTAYGGLFLDVPLKKHLMTYQVNTLGLVAMTYAFLPDMVSRPEAHLVNIASAAGLIGLPYGSTYASSKWSVIGFSESLRLELKGQGKGHVGVTSICPSVVNTALFAGTKPAKTTRRLEPEEIADRIVRAVLANKAFVMAPSLVRLTVFLRGVLPLRVFDWVGDQFGSTKAMATWDGHTKQELKSSGEKQESRPREKVGAQ
ncbi:MAG: SDR family NAD(P)-dependent oxidoreductase [Pirellulales bacterium]|nr:SDR family NAD(P)-dependent oxidoreductase [Pirellulales bacterium]